MTHDSKLEEITRGSANDFSASRSPRYGPRIGQDGWIWTQPFNPITPITVPALMPSLPN